MKADEGNKLVDEIDDLLVLEIRCEKCGGKTILPLNRKNRARYEHQSGSMATCFCNPAIQFSAIGKVSGAIENLISAIEELPMGGEKNKGISARLTIDTDSLFSVCEEMKRRGR